MKRKIKQAVLKRLLTNKQLKRLQSPEINFSGGIVPIHKTELNDVFIVGFPKSGNTLMQHIIAHLVYGINKEGSRSIVNLIVPDIYANTHYFRVNSRCFFKSHNRPQVNYKKVIYLIRDGREALLSYYHMMKSLGNDLSLQDLYEGKIPIYGGMWHEHVNEWEKNPFNAEILFVRYEDLITDKMEVLNNLCAFLDLERSQNELDRVFKCTSFEFMKELEKKNDWKRMKEESNNKGNFVRKGSINSFKDEVAEELLNAFTSRSKNNFYDFLAE